LQLFDWLLFNVLIGNGDNHLKNISFIVDSGGIHIAPAYDLLCTSAYDTRAVANENAHWPHSPLAIPLEGAVVFGEVRRSHLIGVARTLGIAAATAQRHLDRMLKGILNKADQLIAEIQGHKEQEPTGGRLTNEGALRAILAAETRLLDVTRHIVLADIVKQLA
jgi:serine/threonine-protein kinase HipA